MTIVFAIIIADYIESVSISINFEYIESTSVSIEVAIVSESFNIVIDLIIDIFQINSVMKHVCFNNVIVYNFSKTIDSLTVLIDEYQDFFIDKSITMNISKKKWMSINFKVDAEVKSIKIYSLKHKNRKIVNDIFDKLHEQNKMKYITQPISFNFSIFVIWRDTSKKKTYRYKYSWFQ